ncbi:DegT/DnrJ/EryC1/StrS family aminotransferase [Marinobacter sp. M3C]|jgi:dTDP-4-amino-4,6-dideoxygalactose transaminase|uniref:DegT/DnrJ/EryC1/StrS family aminotransferase n=1 Tax=unclassified Marinobacter TaxID=83889 RepID=UPI00200F3D9B|nr:MULTISPECIES: DegT/DnrJ/EryC1/StrS family aminotransferase [unclassified Marinobacter]MCL1479073.1 DegT/DnrJ/EryC1/StrS family aminotransferase [Marinobacter sp.]MCL1485126.1 DegT/DnrJ/EryC1/StrS family aminotransferase [Marinobacter sp.]MCL1488957.1 DegT/DnrJ/EryC1/StrS family aminotransferase [Marinobacter sp.]UQG57151.1 DegT/DnrJ/EryC1/StrS family aminotransferase [Marinobacter sp. M4C]UQG61667.1 DegT/DnrJ/EryC1/StrS family aminotransferase [Marinobacter sp. M3C]
MIPVTKPYLPSREKFDNYLDGIYERQWLTNNGQLVQKLTSRLEEHLGVENLLLVANGTLALQVAYRVLGVSGSASGQKPEAITTPFTFIATASSLKWDGVEPVFVDIDLETWCLDPQNIEAAITLNTRAIVPVHVFGNACDVEKIEAIAQKHNLKVIYDGCHAFGVRYKGESLLKWGDAATLSFHATKLFHTGEGGAIIFKRKEDLERAKKMINFGITGPEAIEELGINAKMNELQAAMGLCVLDEIEQISRDRKAVTDTYDRLFEDNLQKQSIQTGASYNHAYYPVALENEAQVVELLSSLRDSGVLARRYFYPSLDSVGSLDAHSTACSESRKLSERIVCLPIYSGLKTEEIEMISKKVLEVTR